MVKWSKIIQFCIFLAGIVCSDNLFSGQIIKQDPQQWFQTMIQKYPQAGLEKIMLVDGRSWAMGHYSDGKVFVTCPYDTFYGFKPFTPDDELALLHEAGHARNHAWTKLFYKKNYQKKFALALVAAAFVAAEGLSKGKDIVFDCSANFTDHKFDVADKVLKYLLLYGGLSALIYKIIPPILGRCDEILADDFANQQGDAEALQGGYYHFMKHANYQKYAYKNWLHHWIKDFSHPASIDRAKIIGKVLWSKYGQSVPMIL